MDKNYENLSKAIDKAAEAYLDLDPNSAGAKDLVEDISALYAVKNNADKIKNEAKYNNATLAKDKVSRNWEVGLKILGIGAPILAQTGWIVMSFIAEDAGKVLTTRTFRDFVSRALKLRV